MNDSHLTLIMAIILTAWFMTVGIRDYETTSYTKKVEELNYCMETSLKATQSFFRNSEVDEVKLRYIPDELFSMLELTYGTEATIMMNYTPVILYFVNEGYYIYTYDGKEYSLSSLVPYTYKDNIYTLCSMSEADKDYVCVEISSRINQIMSTYATEHGNKNYEINTDEIYTISLETSLVVIMKNYPISKGNKCNIFKQYKGNFGY